MPSNFEQLIFEIIATDKNASAAFDRFRHKVDETSRSVDDNSGKLDRNAKSIENVGKSAGTATPLIGGLGGVSGMGALIGAGVALSPVLATVGVGLAGFGAAAIGIAKPVLDAAQKTGGLKAHMDDLDPASKQLAVSVLGLGKQFQVFEKQLQPEVLGVFGKGLQIAGHLMRDVQPLAKATGNAIGSLLDRVDQEFQSGQWQQFFSWMAANVGPDFQQIGNLTIDLLKTLPHVLELLQPVAHAFLSVADGAIKAADAYVTFIQSQNKKAQRPDTIRSQITDFIKYGYRGHAAADAAAALAAAQADLNKRLADGHAATADLIHPLTAAGGGLMSASDAAKIAGDNVKWMTAQVTALTLAMDKSTTANSTFNKDLIAAATAGTQAAAALKKSHNQIGLHTAAEQNSFQANQGYIDQLVKLTQDAQGSATKQRQASTAIRDALPILERAKGGTQEYRQQVQTLVAWLHHYQDIHDLKKFITVSGKGLWHIAPGTALGLPGGTFGGRAAGGLITGGVAGRDSVPIMAMPGEVVIPTGMVRAGAVDHLRGTLPGFADGGVVGSYSGNVRGLPAWVNSETTATWKAIASATAHAVVGAMRGLFTGGGGALGGSAAANKALAMRLFPWPMSMFPSFDYVEMREAGYSLTATNPSSGAYGMAQFINGPGEYYQWGGNPNTAGGQLIAMWNYIASRYGNPVNAAAHEAAFNWYDAGGWLPPGASIAVNTTGQPERVIGPGGSDRDLLAAILRELRHLNAHGPARTGAAVGGAINGTTRLVGLAR